VDNLAKDNTARLCALLFLDLDRFKAINDVHGHVIGDRVLSTMAARLRGVVRTSDLLIRVGGDEFAVLLESTNESGARAVANKIIATLSSPVDGLSLPNSVSASVGITLFTSAANPGNKVGRIVLAIAIALQEAQRVDLPLYRVFVADNLVAAAKTQRFGQVDDFGAQVDATFGTEKRLHGRL